MHTTAQNESRTRTIILALPKLFGWKVWLIIGGIFLIPFVLTPLMFFFENRPPAPSDQISEYGKEVIPKEYIPIYQRAAEKYDVPWALLAAHHKVETDFGRNLSVSHTGARGHMQFEPCTWVGWKYPGCKGTLGNLPASVDITDLELIQKYGGYGTDGDGDLRADPNNPWDAIFAAAKYLSAHGAKKDVKKAIYAYNHDPGYVSKVEKYMGLFVDPEKNQESQVVSSQSGWVYPLPASRQITSGFSMARKHPVLGYTRPHYGIDFGRPPSGASIFGKSVVSVSDGVVSYSGRMGGYGNVIIIDHGGGISTRYGHLSARSVQKGQTVKKGQVIGKVGQTGLSTAPHLHFEVRVNGTPVDPVKYLR
jgi:hypothetical protein